MTIVMTIAAGITVTITAIIDAPDHVPMKKAVAQILSNGFFLFNPDG